MTLLEIITAKLIENKNTPITEKDIDISLLTDKKFTLDNFSIFLLKYSDWLHPINYGNYVLEVEDEFEGNRLVKRIKLTYKYYNKMLRTEKLKKINE